MTNSNPGDSMTGDQRSEPAEREWSQDEIDEEMFTDAEDGDDDYEACGRWNNGYLTKQCRLAGSEQCDWDCPLSR